MITLWITARWLAPCPRCGAGVLSHGKCVCGLQMPRFSLNKGGRSYEDREESIYEYSNAATDSTDNLG
jgi:hypothetical protein